MTCNQYSRRKGRYPSLYDLPQILPAFAFLPLADLLLRVSLPWLLFIPFKNCLKIKKMKCQIFEEEFRECISNIEMRMMHPVESK
jgi:hypothetical protein